MDGESSENVYERIDVSGKSEEMQHLQLLWSLKENAKKLNDRKDIQMCS